MLRRWLSIALLLTLHGSSAYAAADVRHVGCAKWGYSLSIPTTWGAIGACARQLTVLSDGKTVAIVLKISNHAFWNDVRGRAKIHTDIGAAKTSKVSIDSIVIQHRRYLLGVSSPVKNSDGTPVVFWELVAFQSGYTYAIVAAMVVSKDPSADLFSKGTGIVTDPTLPKLRQEATGTILRTFTITRS